MYVIETELLFSPLPEEIQDRTGEAVIMPLSIAQTSTA